MFPLGHIAVACGGVWLGERAIERLQRRKLTPVAAIDGEPMEADARPWLARAIDYRLVALGALLPDLIDKPLGWVFFREFFDGSSHLFGHTLLFVFLFALPGLWLLLNRADPRILALSFGILLHFPVDPVNHSLHTLLWPFLGTDFPRISFLDRQGNIATDIAAGLLMLAAGYQLYRGSRLERLIREGRL